MSRTARKQEAWDGIRRLCEQMRVQSSITDDELADVLDKLSEKFRENSEEEGN